MNFVKTGYKPLKIQAQRNRIVTISTKLELSWIFDDEVNEYLESINTSPLKDSIKLNSKT